MSRKSKRIKEGKQSKQNQHRGLVEVDINTGMAEEDNKTKASICLGSVFLSPHKM
jgi:hypothetical protein